MDFKLGVGTTSHDELDPSETAQSGSLHTAHTNEYDNGDNPSEEEEKRLATALDLRTSVPSMQDLVDLDRVVFGPSNGGSQQCASKDTKDEDHISPGDSCQTNPEEGVDTEAGAGAGAETGADTATNELCADSGTCEHFQDLRALLVGLHLSEPEGLLNKLIDLNITSVPDLGRLSDNDFASLKVGLKSVQAKKLDKLLLPKVLMQRDFIQKLEASYKPADIEVQTEDGSQELRTFLVDLQLANPDELHAQLISLNVKSISDLGQLNDDDFSSLKTGMKPVPAKKLDKLLLPEVQRQREQSVQKLEVSSASTDLVEEGEMSVVSEEVAGAMDEQTEQDLEVLKCLLVDLKLAEPDKLLQKLIFLGVSSVSDLGSLSDEDFASLKADLKPVPAKKLDNKLLPVILKQRAASAQTEKELENLTLLLNGLKLPDPEYVLMMLVAKGVDSVSGLGKLSDEEYASLKVGLKPVPAKRLDMHLLPVVQKQREILIALEAGDGTTGAGAGAGEGAGAEAGTIASNHSEASKMWHPLIAPDQEEEEEQQPPSSVLCPAVVDAKEYAEADLRRRRREELERLERLATVEKEKNDALKSKYNAWKCNTCKTVNDSPSDKCGTCFSVDPQRAANLTWICSHCPSSNNNSDSCWVCSRVRVAAPGPAGGLGKPQHRYHGHGRRSVGHVSRGPGAAVSGAHYHHHATASRRARAMKVAWTCQKCRLRNKDDRAPCPKCRGYCSGFYRRAHPTASHARIVGLSGSSWLCTECGVISSIVRNNCPACGLLNPGAKARARPFDHWVCKCGMRNPVGAPVCSGCAFSLKAPSSAGDASPKDGGIFNAPADGTPSGIKEIGKVAWWCDKCRAMNDDDRAPCQSCRRYYGSYYKRLHPASSHANVNWDSWRCTTCGVLSSTSRNNCPSCGLLTPGANSQARAFDHWVCGCGSRNPVGKCRCPSCPYSLTPTVPGKELKGKPPVVEGASHRRPHREVLSRKETPAVKSSSAAVRGRKSFCAVC